LTGQSDEGEVVGTAHLLLDFRARYCWLSYARGVTSFGGLVAYFGCFRSEIVMSIALAGHHTAYCASSTSSKKRM
jgi:hypothetical protein